MLVFFQQALPFGDYCVPCWLGQEKKHDSTSHHISCRYSVAVYYLLRFFLWYSNVYNCVHWFPLKTRKERRLVLCQSLNLSKLEIMCFKCNPCWFEICNLIQDFRIFPFINIGLWSWMSCLGVLQIWPPNEQTFLERGFLQKLASIRMFALFLYVIYCFVTENVHLHLVQTQY